MSLTCRMILSSVPIDSHGHREHFSYVRYPPEMYRTPSRIQKTRLMNTLKKLFWKDHIFSTQLTHLKKSFFNMFMRCVFWILDGVLCISDGCCAYEKCSLAPWESIGIDESIIRHVNDILRQENVIFIDFVKTILRQDPDGRRNFYGFDGSSNSKTTQESQKLSRNVRQTFLGYPRYSSFQRTLNQVHTMHGCWYIFVYMKPSLLITLWAAFQPPMSHKSF